MRLEKLISGINEEMYRKIMDNHEADPEEAKDWSLMICRHVVAEHMAHRVLGLMSFIFQHLDLVRPECGLL